MENTIDLNSNNYSAIHNGTIPNLLANNEAILYDDNNINLKTSQEMESESEGKIIAEKLIVTSKKISFIINSQQFDIPYSGLSYHAINKEYAYIMLQLNLQEDLVFKKYFHDGNFEQHVLFKQDETIFICLKDKKETIELFDQISTGSSLNPDNQEENDNIELNGFNNVFIEEGEESEDNEENPQILHDDQYTPYVFTNTIEKIFTTHKQKRDLSENDPRRFEDAD